MSIKRVYVPYWEWEDYLSGMWRSLPKEHEIMFLRNAINFTSNHIIYGNAMEEVMFLWRRTMLNSMTNMAINRRAFLGHCACQYKINCPEYIVRLAWKELTEQQRIDADKIAQEHIDNWIRLYEKKDKRVYSNMGRQMLFRWDS